jgi:tetratricopeptide (TPR) repeat protein
VDPTATAGDGHGVGRTAGIAGECAGIGRTAGIAAWLFGLTALAYLPAIKAGFVWDDDGFVLRPDLHSLHGLGRIWFDLGATEQYYPVLHSAFWLEHLLWGDAAVGYHLINVVLHATAACLFALVLRRLGRRDDVAWLAAFVFALHPVCVESVAWISEQKNTLSTVFYLLAALVYLHWNDVRTPDEGKVGLGGRARPHAPSTPGGSPNERSGAAAQPYPRSTGLYLFALFFFVLALLSKTVTATLPAALLVVVWWQRGRLSWRRDVVPLLPWFALSAAAGLFSGWVERTYIGAQGANFSLSFVQRCLVAGREIWFYLGKLAWPANLIFIYPRWTLDAGAGWQYPFPLGAVALLVALWLMRRRTRAPLAALLFFAGTLFPTLGFFNVYAFIFSYVADHWQYLASLGIIALAAAGWRYLPRLPARIIAAVTLCALGILSWRECRMYGDVETFYRTILDRNPAAWMAQDNLGVVLARTGRLPEAIDHYQKALQLKPDYPETYNNLGNVLAKTGRLPEAIAYYEQAIRLRPASAALLSNLAEAHYELGNALGNAGRLAEAVAQYEDALQVKPDYPEAKATLGFAFANLDRTKEAIALLQEALRLKPDYVEAHAYLGFSFSRAGRFSEAIAEYEAALRLRPGDADIHYNLGLALQAAGRPEEARAQFEETKRLGATP